jgi:hypothetical protein
MDMINGLFELLGAVMMTRSVWKLWCDKVLYGYDPMGTIVFTAYGLWNLIFYPSQGLMWSWYGGVALVAVNGTWLGLLIWLYRRPIKDRATAIWTHGPRGWEYIGRCWR